MHYFRDLSLMLVADLSPPNVGRLAIWSGVLVGVIIVGMVVVSKVKRRMQQPDEPVSAGFTLSDLRQLHKSGQMTDEEFERAKEKVVEAARRAAERQESARNPSNRPGRRDGPAQNP